MNIFLLPINQKDRDALQYNTTSKSLNLLWGIIILFTMASCHQQGKVDYKSWEVYRGDGGSNAYSSLDQINTKNVSRLKIAWIYETGDKSDYVSLECNPIIINDVLYGLSPQLKTFALDAKTGKPLWVFDPFKEGIKGGGYIRGLTYWKSGNDQRIITFVGNKMIELNAVTGKQIQSFGDSGYVDLNKNLHSHEGLNLTEDVTNTSPAVIYKDLIITGSSVGEDYESSPGHIRAYDTHTGEMK